VYSTCVGCSTVLNSNNLMHLHSTSMAAVDFGTGSCCKNRSTLCQLHPEPPPEEHPPVREVLAIRPTTSTPARLAASIPMSSPWDEPKVSFLGPKQGRILDCSPMEVGLNVLGASVKKRLGSDFVERSREVRSCILSIVGHRL
jgi:hypothetical protein